MTCLIMISARNVWDVISLETLTTFWSVQSTLHHDLTGQTDENIAASLQYCWLALLHVASNIMGNNSSRVTAQDK